MMTPLVLTSYIVVLILIAANLFAEYKRDLMMMQQNSYRNDRYFRWLRSSGDSTSYQRLAGLCVSFLALASFTAQLWCMVLLGLFAAGSVISLLNKRYKKPLVWTRRAKRIYAAMIVLTVIIEGITAWLTVKFSAPINLYFYPAVCASFLYCCSHIVIVLSVGALTPVEKAINRKYYNEAAAILRSMPSLTVIGVTGSYGKTSTKHYLERILSESYDVLMTPGSFNTTLGVIRTIRERMKPYNEIFICEMGAKQLNDVREICELVHPGIGIITAVGPQHLESFKTIENVQRTKFELVDSLPEDGLAVVNNDFPYIANRKVSNVNCIRYGISNPGGADFTAKDIAIDSTGTTFTVVGDQRELRLHTRLVGECNVSNLIAAVIVAMHLNVPDDKIRYAVEKIEQVEHRLNMKHTPGGITIIDDAYNSNPTGSAMALDVLASMKSGRRIVITPGMIELGEQQAELNRQFGVKIASSADIAIIVGEYNRQAITEGIESVSASSLQLITAQTFAEAQQILTSMAAPGDTVLYENDLPDTFR